MKLIAIFLIAILAMTYATKTQEAVDTIEGILVGAFGTVGHEAVECIDDGEAIFDNVEIAIKDFMKGDVADIVQGLFYIGKALEAIPAEVKECGNLTELVSDFEKIAEEFKNPKSLSIHIGKEILWHGKSIYHDVNDAVTQFKSEKYEPAGEDIGDIVKILFMDAAVPQFIKVSQ